MPNSDFITKHVDDIVPGHAVNRTAAMRIRDQRMQGLIIVDARLCRSPQATVNTNTVVDVVILVQRAC